MLAKAHNDKIYVFSILIIVNRNFVVVKATLHLSCKFDVYAFNLMLSCQLLLVDNDTICLSK